MSRQDSLQPIRKFLRLRHACLLYDCSPLHTHSTPLVFVHIEMAQRDRTQHCGHQTHRHHRAQQLIARKWFHCKLSDLLADHSTFVLHNKRIPVSTIASDRSSYWSCSGIHKFASQVMASTHSHDQAENTQCWEHPHRKAHAQQSHCPMSFTHRMHRAHHFFLDLQTEDRRANQILADIHI